MIENSRLVLTRRRASTLLISLVTTLLLGTYALGQNQTSQAVDQTEESIGYFLEASKTFRHPRCLNCHPAGDRPTQGDDLHAHIMNVQRGYDDKGSPGMRCASCHNEANYAYSGVPGAPKWALAPKSMAWQGLDDRELCLALKDTEKNHGMSLDELVHHNGEDPLVSWGWNPGANRRPIPGTQKQFGDIIRKWASTGAACPGDESTVGTVLGTTRSKSELDAERRNSKKQQTRDSRTIY